MIADIFKSYDLLRPSIINAAIQGSLRIILKQSQIFFRGISKKEKKHLLKNNFYRFPRRNPDPSVPYIANKF